MLGIYELLLGRLRCKTRYYPARLFVRVLVSGTLLVAASKALQIDKRDIVLTILVRNQRITNVLQLGVANRATDLYKNNKIY